MTADGFMGPVHVEDTRTRTGGSTESTPAGVVPPGVVPPGAVPTSVVPPNAVPPTVTAADIAQQDAAPPHAGPSHTGPSHSGPSHAAPPNIAPPAAAQPHAGSPASTPPGDLIQLLAPDGTRLHHPDYTVDLAPEEYLGLYRDLVLVRRIDAEAVALQRQGELGLWASLLGQEAAQVGSARAMLPDDHVFPTYREHGVAWCRGVDPLNLLALFRGVTNGGWDPAATRFHLYTIVIGAQTLHATGYAMGVQRDGGNGAVVAYFGDGASSQGDVNEAFVFASVFNAPVVFFCQNNQWAISEPTERQSRIPLYQRASGFGFPGVRVDGNDVLACLAVTRAALDHARGGAGPVLVEAFTYRMGAHTNSDDPTRYRHASELDAWRLKDPITRYASFLRREGLADEGFFAQVEAEADALAVRLRDACRRLPDPDPSAMFDHAYAAPHPLVDAERAEFIAYQQSFVTESAPMGEGAGTQRIEEGAR